jgi:hypothetical protein
MAVAVDRRKRDREVLVIKGSSHPDGSAADEIARRRILSQRWRSVDVEEDNVT